MSEFNLDDRRFVDAKPDMVPFQERAPADYVVKPLLFLERHANGSQIGWEFQYAIVSAKLTKAANPNYDPLPEPGKIRTIWMDKTYTGKLQFKTDNAMNCLRTLLAALLAEDYTPVFPANPPLRAFTELGDLSELPEIDMVVSAKLGKDKPGGGRHVNTEFNFSYR